MTNRFVSALMISVEFSFQIVRRFWLYSSRIFNVQDALPSSVGDAQSRMTIPDYDARDEAWRTSRPLPSRALLTNVPKGFSHSHLFLDCFMGILSPIVDISVQPACYSLASLYISVSLWTDVLYSGHTDVSAQSCLRLAASVSWVILCPSYIIFLSTRVDLFSHIDLSDRIKMRHTLPCKHRNFWNLKKIFLAGVS